MFKALKNKILARITEWWRLRLLFDVVQAEKNVTPRIKKIINKGTKPLWFSFWEIIVVVALFIFFLLLTHAQTFLSYKIIEFMEWLYPLKGSPFALMNSNHYQNLITIHAGIGAVLIGLTFFLAQYITKEKNKEYSYKGFVILRRTRFFTLLLSEILFFFLFAWGSVNILAIIPIFLIGIFTLYSLYNALDLIFDNFELKKKEKKIFSESLHNIFLKVLDLEITKLIGNNQLRNLLKDYKDFIEVTPFSPVNKQDYTPIKAYKSGIFTNLNLKTLKKLLIKLKEKAPTENKVPTMGSASKATISGSRTINPYCYLSPRFFSDTKEVNDVLLWVRNDLLKNDKNANEVKKLTHKAFTITKLNFDLEHARSSIRKLKILSLDLIKDQRGDELGEVLNNYTKLIEDFYSYLKPYGGGFSKKQAHDMSMEIFFGGFKLITWISEDIWEIFELGIKSDSKEVIREAGYLPVRLMKYAIDYEDYLIFEQFKYYPFRLYKAHINAQKLGKTKLATFLFDRSWRYLKEISDYYLEPKLKKSEDYPKEEVYNFACSIVKIFQELLKNSFDERDLKSFKIYLTTVNGLFRHLDITNRYNSKEEEKDANFLKNKKNEMLFGLTSWIFYKLDQNKNDEIVKKFYNAIQNLTPSQVEELTNIFSRAHSSKISYFWGWDDWEMSEKRDGEVHSIQTLEKLERFYAIRSLSLLSEKNDEEIKKIKLPPSRDLAYLAEGMRDLTKTLDNIKTAPGNWRFILNNNAISKVNPLKALLNIAKEAQEKEEVEFKKKQTISQKRVQEFKKEVLKTYYEGANMRDIFKKHFATYEDKIEEETDEKDRFGINIVDDKASFFDEWHISSFGLGGNYGQDLASGENFYLFDDIAANCEEITKEDFKVTIAKFKNPDDIVILATNIASWQFFNDSKNFKPKWYKDIEQLNIKGFSGWYDFNGILIPVFEMYHQKINKRILILDKLKVGSLVQLSPLDRGEKDEFIEDIFYINIQGFSENEELIKELIIESPEWLKNIGNKLKQHEYLCERVSIQIFEKFKYKKSENFKGYKLSLK